MTVSVVILNWNTKEHLETFLPSVVAASGQGRIVVADNGSDDGSVEMLKGGFPSVRIIELGENLGFTGGYDRAVSQLLAEDDAPDVIVLLNSDVRTPQGWLSPLMDYLEKHPDCGICGPKILCEKEPDRFEYAGAAGGFADRFGYPFCRGRVLHLTQKDRGQYDSGVSDVLWVSGAAMAVRSSVWKELGGLDGCFFAHMEEIDFCWRAQLAGHRVCVIPESRVYHLGGGTLANGSPLKMKLNFRNSLLLLEKNLPATVGKRRAALRIFIRKVLDAGSAAVYLLSGRKEYFKAVLQAHREYRRLRKGIAVTSGSSPEGSVWRRMMRLCILPLYAVKRERVFKFLARYENCN